MIKFKNGLEVQEHILLKVGELLDNIYIYLNDENEVVLSLLRETKFMDKKVKFSFNNKDIAKIKFSYKTSFSDSVTSIKINENNEILRIITDECIKYKELWAYDFDNDVLKFLYTFAGSLLIKKENTEEYMLNIKNNIQGDFKYKAGFIEYNKDSLNIVYINENIVQNLYSLYVLLKNNNKRLLLLLSEKLYEINFASCLMIKGESFTINETDINQYKYGHEIIFGTIQ